MINVDDIGQWDHALSGIHLSINKGEYVAMGESIHPAASEHLPGFITAPGQTDVLMIIGWDGRLLGTDPDPNIRFQLMRDQSQGGD